MGAAQSLILMIHCLDHGVILHLVPLGQCSLSVLLNLLSGRSVHDPLPPSPVIGKIMLKLLFETLAHCHWDQQVPWNEGKICVGVLVANKIFIAGSLEVRVEDSQNTLDLAAVTVNGRLNLLGVVYGEPDTLTEVWALTRDLEVEPAA